MAVDFQFGPRITAFTRLVTNACPAPTLEGGCWLTGEEGITHDTAGEIAPWPLAGAA
jgi:hypothetical protein